MAHKNDVKGNHGLETGKDVVEFAKRRNASTFHHGLFTGIETPKGKMYVSETDEKMDKHTKANVKRWLKLLGLMLFLFLCAYPIFIRMI